MNFIFLLLLNIPLSFKFEFESILLFYFTQTYITKIIWRYMLIMLMTSLHHLHFLAFRLSLLLERLSFTSRFEIRFVKSVRFYFIISTESTKTQNITTCIMWRLLLVNYVSYYCHQTLTKNILWFRYDYYCCNYYFNYFLVLFFFFELASFSLTFSPYKLKNLTDLWINMR